MDMCVEKPDLDVDGLPTYLPKVGGNRRVDRILFNKQYQLVIPSNHLLHIKI